MRRIEERRAEKEWRQQEAWKRRREANRERAIIERKCFICGGFGHIAHYYRNRRDIEESRRTEIGKPEFWPSNN